MIFRKILFSVFLNFLNLYIDFYEKHSIFYLYKQKYQKIEKYHKSKYIGDERRCLQYFLLFLVLFTSYWVYEIYHYI